MYDSMVFYRSFYEGIRRLPEKSRAKLYDAVFAYGLDGEEMELDEIESAMFQLIKPQIDANNRRKENGMKGGRPKTETKPKHNLDETKPKPRLNLDVTKHEPNVNVNANVNDKEKVSPIGDTKKKTVRFSPPTLSEVRSYCQEKGLTVDAERFVNFYEAKGWMVGKNKMKDWKAAVRGWASREKSEGKKATKFSNFHERKYDDSVYLNLIEM